MQKRVRNRQKKLIWWLFYGKSEIWFKNSEFGKLVTLRKIMFPIYHKTNSSFLWHRPCSFYNAFGRGSTQTFHFFQSGCVFSLLSKYTLHSLDTQASQTQSNALITKKPDHHAYASICRVNPYLWKIFFQLPPISTIGYTFRPIRPLGQICKE